MPSPAGKGDHEVVDEEVTFSRASRPLITLFRCKRYLVPQEKIHDTPVTHILRATSSSTAYAVPLLRWRRLFVKPQFYIPAEYLLFKLDGIITEHWYGGYKGVAISRNFEAADIFKAVSDHYTQIRCVLTIVFSQK